jgi:mono/diheme cytochrome c family protein
MKTRYRTASIVMLAFCVVAATVWPSTGAPSQQDETSAAQTSMRGIFFTLTMIYTLSLDAEQYEDPANHAQIQGGLQALVANVSELDRHGAGLNPSYGYFRHSLAKDAEDALNRFNEGQYMGSRFVVGKMTENCVSCHTKLPSRQEFELGAEFTNKSKIRKLKPEERVQIELALRQFDTALATYEELFAVPEMSPENLALLAAYSGYLRLCVSVLDDPARAAATLKKYGGRKDLSATFKKQLDGWVAALEAADLDSAAGDELATARELINGAEAARANPADRSGLVDYVIGSTLLNRYIESNPSNEADLAEAFYLMGVAESRISRSYWVSETDYLLDRAIRTAPKSEVAKQAYAFLAEYTISAHAETSAREVSPDMQADLEELRKLIEE